MALVASMKLHMPECFSGLDNPATLGQEGGPSSFIVKVFTGHICHVLAVARLVRLRRTYVFRLDIDVKHSACCRQSSGLPRRTLPDLRHTAWPQPCNELGSLAWFGMLRIVYNDYLCGPLDRSSKTKELVPTCVGTDSCLVLLLLKRTIL